MPSLNELSIPDLYRHFSGTGLVRRLIELARDEDTGKGAEGVGRVPGGGGGGVGDVTSLCSVSESAQATGRIVARDNGRLAGMAALPELLEAFGSSLRLSALASDGDSVSAGSTVATLSGSKRELLAIERTVLNLLGRLSGVATAAAAFVFAANTPSPVKARIYDTRKTTPGLRVLEKYATRCGGAMCHRTGLFDAVLIKDNHIAGVAIDALARVLADAAQRAKSEHRVDFVEVEVDTLEQFARVLTVQPGLIDIVLLDNMSPIQLRQAVALRDKAASRIELEASGGIRMANIRTIAETGIDRISIGAITHSAPWLDIALDIAG